jgi:hypothetical protein
MEAFFGTNTLARKRKVRLIVAVVTVVFVFFSITVQNEL